MKFLARLAVLIYVTAFILIGIFIGLFALGIIPVSDVVGFLHAVTTDVELRLATGLVALGILFLNYLFFKTLATDRQKEKTLAFDNPGGRVTVSVNALEDMVRRVMTKNPDVKEVRSTIKAGRKRLIIQAKVTLNTEVNIPEMTSSLQEAVKSRLQDAIGLEEAVEVHIHVNSMVPASRRVKKNIDDDTEPEENKPTVPFRGYRA